MSDPKDKTLLLTWVCWQQGRIEDIETFAGDMEKCHTCAINDLVYVLLLHYYGTAAHMLSCLTMHYQS